MRFITPFKHPIPHVEASVRYIQEMNLDMMDAIWPEEQINFSGISKALLMEQFAIFFENALYDDDLVLQLRIADSQDENGGSEQPVYFFTSPLTQTYFALRFCVKDDLITSIEIINSDHDGKPEGCVRWRFRYLDGPVYVSPELKERLDIILEIRQVIKDFEEVEVWETNDLFAFLDECWAIFQKHDDYIDEGAPNSLQFATLTSFMSDIFYSYKEREQIHAAFTDWKLACLLNSRKMKFDVFFDYADLFSHLLINQFTVEGNAFIFFDDCINQERVIRLNDDLSFITGFINEVMPGVRAYHQALITFFEFSEVDEEPENINFLLNIKNMAERRAELLRNRRSTK